MGNPLSGKETGPAETLVYAPSPQGEGEVDFRKWFHLALTYRWLVFGIVASATLVGAVSAYLKVPLYRAQATVYVDRSQAPPVSDSVVTSSYDLSEETFYTSQLAIIESKAVAQIAVDKLGLATREDFKDDPDPAGTFLGYLDAHRRKDSSVFEISVSSPEAEDVAPWANAAAEAYAEFNIRQNAKFLSDTNQLIMGEAKKLEEEYARVQKQYTNLLAASGTYYPKAQKQILESRLESLELRKNQILIQKQEVDAEIAELRPLESGTRDPLTVGAVRSDPTIQGLVGQFEAGQRDLARMAAQYTPQYPPYVKKAQEQEALKERIRSQALMLLRAQESRRQAIATELASLERDLQELRTQGFLTSGGGTQLEAFGSGVEALEKYMTLLNEKMREMDVSSKLLSSQVRVLDRASPPGGPYYPNRRRTILLSFLVGLMLSGGCLAAIQFFSSLDTRVKDSESLQNATGLPVIGQIPLKDEENKILVMEALQALRTNLYYASDQKKKNVVLVTSATAGDGKTFVTANLGMTLAKTGDRVLLIDADFRRSSLDKMLGLHSGPGLAEFLVADEGDPRGYIDPVPGASLWLLRACEGKPPANPPALFCMGEFLKFLDAAKKEYDWVLIDTPPVLAVTDAMIIAEHVDLLLLVASMRSTHMPMFLKGIEELSRLDKEVAGIALNRFDWRVAYAYKHYYRAHYHYYGENHHDATRTERIVAAVTGLAERFGGKRPKPKGPHTKSTVI